MVSPWRVTPAGGDGSSGLAPITSYMDLDELLRRVLPYATASANAELSRRELPDAAARALFVAAAGGPVADSLRGRRFADTVGIPGAVLASGQARLLIDVPERSHPFQEIERASGCLTRSLMTAPLKVGGRTLGVVEAVNKLGGGAFQGTALERFMGSCSLIAVAVENASLYRHLGKESELLKRWQEDRTRPLIARSPAMRRALAQAERAAGTKSTVLIVGETGTGKEQLARRIHELSSRAKALFVPLNCGALPEGLLESDLVGHENCAF